MRVNCGPDGGMEIDRDFFVDLDDRADGPARAHEVRLQGGDCTTEIFHVTFAHLVGIPVEESALTLAPAGAAIVSGVALFARSKMAGTVGWLRRH